MWGLVDSFVAGGLPRYGRVLVVDVFECALDGGVVPSLGAGGVLFHLGHEERGIGCGVDHLCAGQVLPGLPEGVGFDDGFMVNGYGKGVAYSQVVVVLAQVLDFDTLCSIRFFGDPYFGQVGGVGAGEYVEVAGQVPEAAWIVVCSSGQVDGWVFACGEFDGED